MIDLKVFNIIFTASGGPYKNPITRKCQVVAESKEKAILLVKETSHGYFKCGYFKVKELKLTKESLNWM